MECDEKGTPNHDAKKWAELSEKNQIAGEKSQQHRRRCWGRYLKADRKHLRSDKKEKTTVYATENAP